MQPYGHHTNQVPLLTTKSLNIFLLLLLHLPLFLQRLLCLLSCIIFVGLFLFKDYLFVPQVNLSTLPLYYCFLWKVESTNFVGQYFFSSLTSINDTFLYTALN